MYFSQKCKVVTTYENKSVYHINKNKKDQNLSSHRKIIWQNSTPYYDKNTEINNTMELFNLIKDSYKKNTANIILTGEKKWMFSD